MNSTSRFPFYSPNELPIGRPYLPEWLMIDGESIEPQPVFVHREVTREDYYAYWQDDGVLPPETRFYEVSVD
jgi:hypothetical protein